MTEVDRLTPFQRRCEEAVAQLLHTRQSSSFTREVAGVGEGYIVITGGPLSLFIHEDGAEWILGGEYPVFEREDFPEEPLLITSFLAEVEYILETGRHPPRKSWRQGRPWRWLSRSP